MILYLCIISFCTVLISTIVAPFYRMNFLNTLGYTVLAVVFVLLLDAVVATVARLLPSKLADHNKKIFIVSASEKKFYEKLKIRKWKDYIPEIGQFTRFRKNKLVDPKSVEYLDRFLLESCYGEIGHFSSAILGFLILLAYGMHKVWFAVAIPVAIINALMNLPSFIILRYNSYKLVVLRKSLLKKMKRENAPTMSAMNGELCEESALAMESVQG